MVISSAVCVNVTSIAGVWLLLWWSTISQVYMWNNRHFMGPRTQLQPLTTLQINLYRGQFDGKVTCMMWGEEFPYAARDENTFRADVCNLVVASWSCRVFEGRHCSRWEQLRMDHCNYCTTISLTPCNGEIATAATSTWWSQCTISLYWRLKKEFDGNISW